MAEKVRQPVGFDQLIELNLPVSQLTRSVDIKLNERVLLRCLFEILSSCSRTVWPDVHFPRQACVIVRSGVRRPIP
jgi:hypothetical protein